MKKNRLILIFVLILILVIVIKNINRTEIEDKINASLMLIEFERIEGILQWEKN